MAGLLAQQLNADLLVLLSDVEGLYSGPPSDPKSKLIHTYVKEKHQDEITFGDKSRLGRGGMTAKVNAAVSAASAGIPVVITRYNFLLIEITEFGLNYNFRLAYLITFAVSINIFLVDVLTIIYIYAWIYVLISCIENIYMHMKIKSHFV